VVFGQLGNFPLLGLIWGTLLMVSGVFLGVRKFSFMGLIWGSEWMVLSGFWGIRQFSFMRG
jgi:hypothetical protein